MPLIQAKDWSIPKRHTVLAAMMAVVFSASIALAYAWTNLQAKWSPPPQATLPTSLRLVDVSGLRLGVPANWQLVKTPPTNTIFDARALLVDPQSPSRALLLASLQQAQPRAPLDMLNALIIKLLPTRPTDDGQAYKEIIVHRSFISFRQDETNVVYAKMLTQLARGDLRLHLVAVLTDDNKRFWVIYLSHVFAAQTLSTTSDVIRQDVTLITQILATAHRQKPDRRASPQTSPQTPPGSSPRPSPNS